MADRKSDVYNSLLEQGRSIYPGMRIGRPGRARTYFTTIFFMRLLRLRYSVKVTGSANVGKGAAILVGNHIAAMDPVAAVIKHWWRVTAFAKVEVFENRGAIFFRWMGQIPLRRGDETSTVDGNLKVDRKRQLKSGPPEQYWTGDYRGGLVRDSGFGSP